MVDRFISKPIELPVDGSSIARADLIFNGVDHSGASFEARIYINDRKATQKTGRDHKSYVGSFFIFGHGGCFGDVGHCDIPTDRDAFDFRPPHELEPAQRIVTVTEEIKALLDAGKEKFTVTVVAQTPGKLSNDVLAFTTVRLATYA